MIVTRELRDVVKMGLRDMRYDIGPIITLIDGPSFEFQWEERPRLLTGQIEGADIVAISRADLIDKERVEQICTQLGVTDQPLLLSKYHSSSIDLLVNELLSKDQGE